MRDRYVHERRVSLTSLLVAAYNAAYLIRCRWTTQTVRRLELFSVQEGETRETFNSGRSTDRRGNLGFLSYGGTRPKAE